MSETTTPTTGEMTQAELESLAAQLVQDLRHVRERIPGFVLPHKTQPRLTGRAASVPLAAVEAGFAACENQEALQKSVDVPSVQFDHQFSGIFAELSDEAITLAAGLKYTISLKRFRVGQATLRVYNVARTLGKAPENAHLRAIVDVMDKALNRRRRRSKTPEPAPAPGSGATPHATEAT